MAYVSSFIHEIAHAGAAFLLGIKPEGIEVGLLGMKLNLPPFLCSKEKLIICIAGPLASFFTGSVIFAVGRILHIKSEAYTFFSFTNFAIGIVNLIPVFPLDGLGIIRSLLTSGNGIINAGRQTDRISDFVSLVLGSGIFTMCLCKVFNPALVGIYLFLIISREKQKSIGISEKNLVLSGKINPGKRVKYIACDAESELLCLAGYISCDYTLIVASFYNEKFFLDLNGEDIIKGISRYGALCTVREYAEIMAKEKKDSSPQ